MAKANRFLRFLMVGEGMIKQKQISGTWQENQDKMD